MMFTRKQQLSFGLILGIGTGLAIIIAGLCFDLIPMRYSGVFWLIFMPVIIYFTRDDAKRSDLLPMILSFVIGLAWGFVGVVLTPILKPLGPIPFAIVLYFLIIVAILFVHKGVLANTPFNRVTCVYLAFAESIAIATIHIPVDGMGSAFLPPMTFHAFDLLALFAIGSIVILLIDLFCGMLLSKLFFKGNTPGSANMPERTSNT